MAATGVELIGDKELLKKMKRLEAVGQQKSIGDAAFLGAKLIRDKAKTRASLVTKKITGRLLKSIKAKRGRGKRNVGTATVEVDRKIAPHSHLVEFGTGPRYHWPSGKYAGQMPALPYFRPTADNSKERVKRIMKRGVEQALKKVASR